jgi:hypothetical protein
MKIGENGLLEFGEIKDLTNEQIIWLYLSLKTSYIARKDEFRKKMKQLEALKQMMDISFNDEDSDSDQKPSQMLEKINEQVEKLKKDGDEFPEDKYLLSICSFLKPKFLLIKGADEDLINQVVEDCFNKDNKALQKVLAESEDNA